MNRCLPILALLLLCGCVSSENGIALAPAEHRSATVSTSPAAPRLLPGIFEASGDLGELASLQIEITEAHQFIATLTWWDHLPSPQGLEPIRKRQLFKIQKNSQG